MVPSATPVRPFSQLAVRSARSSEEIDALTTSKIISPCNVGVTICVFLFSDKYLLLNNFFKTKDMADSYSPKGDMYEGYLDIKKPFVIDANGDKWSGIAIDKETKDLIQAYGGSVFKEKGKCKFNAF